MERSTHSHPQSGSYSREPPWLRQLKIPGKMLKKSASAKKVEVQAKVEIKRS
jgi:hypothetical protein